MFSSSCWNKTKFFSTHICVFFSVKCDVILSGVWVQMTNRRIIGANIHVQPRIYWCFDHLPEFSYCIYRSKLELLLRLYWRHLCSLFTNSRNLINFHHSCWSQLQPSVLWLIQSAAVVVFHGFAEWRGEKRELSDFSKSYLTSHVPAEEMKLEESACLVLQYFLLHHTNFHDLKRSIDVGTSR